MRILFLAEYYPPMIQGGAEVSLPILAQELAKRHEVHVLTPNYRNAGNAERKDGKVHIHEFPSIRRLFFQAKRASGAVYAANRNAFSFLLGAAVKIFVREMSEKLEQFCADKKFDVIHANNYESSLSLADANVRGAKVAHLRDLRLMKSPVKGMKFVAISDFLGKKYAPLLGEDIITVYNPVKPAPPAKKDHGIVLFVGSLTEHKGARLLPAIASCISGRKLIALGEGPERQALQNSPNIVLKGFVRDTKKYYAKAPLLVVPSQWEEGFGRVVAEGQANGCVVVATRKGAIPELIEDGKTGILADSVKEMCKALNMPHDMMQRISVSARNASKKYEPSVIARQMENIYKNMLQ